MGRRASTAGPLLAPAVDGVARHVGGR